MGSEEQILLLFSAVSMCTLHTFAAFRMSSVCLPFIRPSADFYDVQTIKLPAK